MEFNEQDNEVIRMLSKLREAESAYPVDMMASRRKNFVKQIAALGIGTGAAIAIKEGAKAAGGSSIPPIAGTIVETALIVAIVAEASFVALVHREKVLDVFRTISGQPTAEQITTTPESPLILLGLTEPTQTAMSDTPETAVVTETPTVVNTPIGTPSPELLLVTEAISAAAENTEALQVNATSVPNDNNGNHYGQTPIPERTKESGGGGGSSNQNNNNNDNRNNGRGN